jgi:hypothetical protein
MLFGSAVIEPLSLKNPAPSWISASGSDQFAPPSTERATSIALEDPAANAGPVKPSASA